MRRVANSARHHARCARPARNSRATARTFASVPAPPTSVPTRRVVVTGVGLVTPLGIGVDRTWGRLVKGECGVTVSGRLLA